MREPEESQAKGPEWGPAEGSGGNQVRGKGKRQEEEEERERVG